MTVTGTSRRFCQIHFEEKILNFDIFQYFQTLLLFCQGVASFMEYKCVEAVFPEMNAAALFQLSVTPMGVRRLHAGLAATLTA